MVRFQLYVQWKVNLDGDRTYLLSNVYLEGYLVRFQCFPQFIYREVRDRIWLISESSADRYRVSVQYMVFVAQSEECLIVVQEVVGS